jgi:deazaflavin-dependent oxidoreductase (nitroreductase family)
MERAQAVEFWRHHLQVWNDSGATEMTHLAGMDVIELVTVGRRSGQERSVLLTSLTVDDGWVVVASNLGADTDPNWWSNLVAGDFRGRVRAPGGAWYDVEASDLRGDERAATWQQVIAVHPDYAEYEHATIRHIPLVHLRRVTPGA